MAISSVTKFMRDAVIGVNAAKSSIDRGDVIAIPVARNSTLAVGVSKINKLFDNIEKNLLKIVAGYENTKKAPETKKVAATKEYEPAPAFSGGSASSILGLAAGTLILGAAAFSETATKFISSSYERIKTISNSVVDWLSDKYTTVTEAVSKFWSDSISFFKGIVLTGYDEIIKGAHGLYEGGKSILDYVSDKSSSILSFVETSAQGILEALKDLDWKFEMPSISFPDISGMLKDFWNNIFNKTQEWSKKVLDAIDSSLSTTATYVKEKMGLPGSLVKGGNPSAPPSSSTPAPAPAPTSVPNAAPRVASSPNAAPVAAPISNPNAAPPSANVPRPNPNAAPVASAPAPAQSMPSTGNSVQPDANAAPKANPASASPNAAPSSTSPTPSAGSPTTAGNSNQPASNSPAPGATPIVGKANAAPSAASPQATPNAGASSTPTAGNSVSVPDSSNKGASASPNAAPSASSPSASPNAEPDSKAATGSPNAAPQAKPADTSPFGSLPSAISEPSDISGAPVTTSKPATTSESPITSAPDTETPVKPTELPDESDKPSTPEAPVPTDSSFMPSSEMGSMPELNYTHLSTDSGTFVVDINAYA